MQKTRPVGEDDLTAYVDGELAEDRRALVEKWLEDHPDAKRRVQQDIEIRNTLQDALAPLADVPLPDRFRVDNVRASLRRENLFGLRRMAAVVALIAIGGAGGWFLRGNATVPTGAPTEIDQALAAYRVYVPEKLHPVEVSADARDHLGVWLGKRIGSPISIPDLTSEGLELVGGRLLPGTDGPAGQLMYQAADGSRVTLYLERGRGSESAFVFSRKGKVGALAWRSPELNFVLAGEMDRENLMRIAHVIYPVHL